MSTAEAQKILRLTNKESLSESSVSKNCRIPGEAFSL
jgi:hypothetical protein